MYQCVKAGGRRGRDRRAGVEAGGPAGVSEPHPFFTRQKHIVREFAGTFDPEDIEDSIRVGAYQGLLKALTEMTPTEVIQEISTSGLRGRGGAGFPTGLKWSTVAKAAGSPKYVVCNGDEGDPGAFMDRSVMEGDPHRIIEGMAIAAYAVGAERGYIYCAGGISAGGEAADEGDQPGEPQRASGAEHFRGAVQLRHRNPAGGRGVCVRRGDGAAGVDRRQPRDAAAAAAVPGELRAVRQADADQQRGDVSRTSRRSSSAGGAWFATIGTAKSKGTKIFALTGKIVNTGLIEVPMGITLREIIFEMGGGIPDGRKFKAVQTGGPSGGCIPEQPAGSAGGL